MKRSYQIFKKNLSTPLEKFKYNKIHLLHKNNQTFKQAPILRKKYPSIERSREQEKAKQTLKDYIKWINNDTKKDSPSSALYMNMTNIMRNLIEHHPKKQQFIDTFATRSFSKRSKKEPYGMEEFVKHQPNEFHVNRPVERDTKKDLREGVGSVQGVAQQYIQTKSITNYLNTMHRRMDDAIERSNFSMKKLGYIVGGVVLVIYVFWASILAFFGDQTSLVAKKTLDSEDVHLSAQFLTSEVVVSVLTDPNTTTEVINLLRNLINRPETQVLLVDLLLHILKDDRTMHQLHVLVSDQLKLLLEDENTMAVAQDFVYRLLQKEDTKNQLVGVVQHTLSDPELVEWIQQWASNVVTSDNVINATTTLSNKTVKEIMEDEDMKIMVANFANDVLSERSIQQKAGYALWEAVGWAVVPSYFKPPPPKPAPKPVDALYVATQPITPDLTKATFHEVKNNEF
mmetsp:Transcript_335/g.611  ORF Transcript_335/g.611 Transcript_335/m.611 type:complete len:456 (+) Transcript_335:148-1515(+)